MDGPTRGNLRLDPSVLIGRESLLGSVVDAVRSQRLVVLTGVGGVGKTRLATVVAEAVADEFPEGVWIVELEHVVDGSAVPDALATILGIAPQGERSLTATIADVIAARRLLLVLDNCEHVIEVAAGLVRTVLERPGPVKILATSRASLGLAGERQIQVPPLALDGGASSPAVILFAQRAREVRPNFALEDGLATAPAVVEICRVLDGLPLGIELAAARMAGMGAIDVRDRLGDRFRLLEGLPQAPARQRSLPDLVRWSVDLLEPAAREVLAQASVFAGGFDLETFVGTFDVADDVQLLRSLDRLVRSSLIVAEHGRGRVRYRLLETIRQYGLEELEAASALEAARDAHARHFAEEASARWERWNGSGWRSVVDWLTVELPNLRAAFGWSSERDVETAADIAGHAALIGTSAHQFEPIGWVERILERADEADIPRLPRLYAAAGYTCFVGRPATAVAYANRAMTLEARPEYDPCEPGLSKFIGALANVYAGDLARYVELSATAAELTGNARAFARPALVDGLQASGRLAEALERLDDAVACAREVGNPFWIAYALWIAGTTLAKTDAARALAAWDEGLEVVDHDGVEFFRGFIARDAARLHTEAGDTDTALTLFDSAIEVFQRAGNIAQLIITLASVPALFERLGSREAAATLQAAMAQVPESAEHVPELDLLGKQLTVELGDAIAEPAATGRAMDLDQAATYTRGQIELVRRQEERKADLRPGGLSRRELEILHLVADGLTTREIAERLFISPKTADRHIQNLYTKIGTSTRATATRWAIDNGVVSSKPSNQT
jgi:predicted ATPase/DNA-binding CsgD family transcriptional regulator